MWTFIAAAIYFVDNSKHIPKHNCLSDTLTVVLLIAFGISHLLFVSLNQRALSIGKRIWEKIFDQLSDNKLEEIKVNVEEITKHFEFRKQDKRWILFQTSATILLLIVWGIVYFQTNQAQLP
jgi:succinate dehydrogenase hydrophobic anchor subunit